MSLDNHGVDFLHDVFLAHAAFAQQHIEGTAHIIRQAINFAFAIFGVGWLIVSHLQKTFTEPNERFTIRDFTALIMR